MPASILCVDDDVRDLELNEIMLRDAGFNVLIAQDTRAAMEIFMRDAIDLVLLDFKLQTSDGGILAFEMRRRKPEVKVAFFCGEPKAPMPNHIVDAVIGKNYSKEQIISEINLLLGDSASRVA